MAHPKNYPERMKESIFAYHADGGGDPGDVTILFTRAGSKLKAYWLTYLGSHPDGDLVLALRAGSIGNISYNPEAEKSEPLADVVWNSEDGSPRLSRPVRRWLSDRDYVLADRGNSLETLICEQRLDVDL